MATIRARRVDATAREMMTSGVTLSHQQEATLSDEQADWLRDRLGLRAETDDHGVTYHQAERS